MPTAPLRSNATSYGESSRDSQTWSHTPSGLMRYTAPLTLPGLGLANPLPVWLTVLVISRDVVIVLTVTIVNLAFGPRTFRPSIYGKAATATYILTAVAAMLFNYLGRHSVVVDLFVAASLVITLVSSLHYIWHAARIIEQPGTSA